MKKIHMLLAACLLLVLAACGAEDAQQEEEEERIATVDVAEVVKDDLTIERTLIGRIAPNSSAPIMLEMPGEVSELEVKNGDTVGENDRIATISTPAGSQTIRAPQDGVIASLQGSEGDFVSNEEPFVVVADMTPPAVDLSVTEYIAELLEADETVTVTIHDEEYEATVESIDPMPDETALYPVTLTLDEEETEDQEIVPGAVAEIVIPEERLEDVLLVPSEAIVAEADEHFVYIIDDDIAVKRAVTVKESQSEQTAIESDEVEAGDQVVTAGQLTLSDGAQVNIAGGE